MAYKWPEWQIALPEEIERMYSRLIIKPEIIVTDTLPPGPWPGKYDHLEESFVISIKKDKPNGT